MRGETRFLYPTFPDVSGMPRYGNHLSKEEVDELIAPSPTAIESLEAWLTYHGIDPISSLSRTDAGDWVTVTVPIGKVEKMLNAKYYVYRHVGTGETIVRTTSYSLPSVLHEHISVIAPTTYFGTVRAMKSHIHIKEPVDDQDLTLRTGSTQAGVPNSCINDITPTCLFALYNATGYKPTATGKNILGAAGYLGQFANYKDLQVCTRAFLRSLRESLISTPPFVFRPSSRRLFQRPSDSISRPRKSTAEGMIRANLGLRYYSIPSSCNHRTSENFFFGVGQPGHSIHRWFVLANS